MTGAEALVVGSLVMLGALQAINALSHYASLDANRHFMRGIYLLGAAYLLYGFFTRGPA